LFDQIYKGKKVFVTGHTGFKGSWLCLWLQQLGAEVIGFSIDTPSEPAHFNLLKLKMVDLRGDIRNKELILQKIVDYQPDIIFHLAAQPIVRLSYDEPFSTFETNVMGTINVLEAARKCKSCKAVVNITSDKCYENKEWERGYVETDSMGGFDPYSASKGCAELVTSSWRRSFMRKEGILLASARAGNVIGGGDWATDRLMPDIFKSANKKEKVKIRNPFSTRPWQHVLEPLGAYLLLGQKLLEGKTEFAEGWNFGPDDEDSNTVESVLNETKTHWNAIDFEIEKVQNQLHEAGLLKLNIEKSKQKLGWKPIWHFSKTIEITALWYKDFYTKKIDVYQRSLADLNNYIDAYKNSKICH
jgi:CDP-glucose 4,6-dehydratase